MARAQAIAERLTGRAPPRVVAIGGGGNSRVFRVDTTDGPLALKLYPADGRDRLGREFAALTFLARHGVAPVPRPIAADPEAGAGLYQWLDGAPVGALDDGDMAQVFAFLGSLKELARADGALDLAPASAACLCPADAFRQLAERVERLRRPAATEPELAGFLAAFDPIHQALADLSAKRLAKASIDAEAGLPLTRRFLSPSDFGRHNMLRGADGRLVFLDFEYFGWDDPVKAACDIALHPGSAFDDRRRAEILAWSVHQFGAADAAFAARLAALTGPFTLIWCAIALNAFLAPAADEVRRRQLDKAWGLLRRIGEDTNATAHG